MLTAKIDLRTFRSDPDKRIDLVSEVHTLSSMQLDKLMEGMLLNISDALFELMVKVEDQQQLNEHFNLMRELRLSYSALLNEFNEQMADAWNQLLFKQHALVLPKVNRVSVKTLTCFVRRVRSQYKPLLGNLESNLGVLLEQESVIHPLCPEFLYGVFWHSTASLKLTIPERLLLVPLFSRFVADRIGIVLAVTNDLFLERIELHEEDADSTTQLN